MLTKEGYAPSELNPVHLNRWESFWSKRGFYQEKTTKAENYAQYVKSQKGLERDRSSYNE